MDKAFSETLAALSRWSDSPACISVQIWRGVEVSPPPFEAFISNINSERLILVRTTGGPEIVVELEEARLQGPLVSPEDEEFFIISPSKLHGDGVVILTRSGTNES